VGVCEKPLKEEGMCTCDGKKPDGRDGSFGAMWFTVEVVGFKLAAWI